MGGSKAPWAPYDSPEPGSQVRNFVALPARPPPAPPSPPDLGYHGLRSPVRAATGWLPSGPTIAEKALMPAGNYLTVAAPTQV